MLFCEAKPFQSSDDSGVHPVFRGRQHVHLMADTKEELLTFTEALGIPQHWIQTDSFGLHHFDITGVYMRRIQLEDCVQKLSRRDFVEKCKELRAARIVYIQDQRKQKCR